MEHEKNSKNSNVNKREHAHSATGYSDNYQPLEALDLSKVNTVNDMVNRMKNCAFGARNVGEAADVLETMIKDKDCFKVLTLSGAMTVAKMGLVKFDFIPDSPVHWTCYSGTGIVPVCISPYKLAYE